MSRHQVGKGPLVAVSAIVLGVGSLAYYIFSKSTINDAVIEGFEDEEKVRSECSKIKEKIQELTKDNPVNIMVIGPKGVGKTSFINTTLSALSDFSEPPRNDGAVGTKREGTDGHVTRHFRKFPALEGTGVHLIDTIGVEQKDGSMNYKDILQSVIEGRIPRLDLEDLKNQNFQHNEIDPAEMTRDTINHGIIVITDPQQSKEELKGFYDPLLVARTKMERNIPMTGGVARLDVMYDCCPGIESFRTDVWVQQEIKRASDQMDIGRCFPLWSYTRNDYEQDWRKNLMALCVLRDIVGSAVRFKNQYPGPEEFDFGRAPRREVAP